MRPFDYYTKTTTIPPNQRDYETIYLYHAGKVLWVGHWYDSDYPETPENLEKENPGAVRQHVLDEDRYLAHRLDHKIEADWLIEEFKLDLFKEFNVSKNLKRFECYELARSRCKGDDLKEIYEEFFKLCPLIL